MSDHKGARSILDALPKAKSLIADRGHDSNRLRKALIDKGILPCIPSTRSRKVPIPHDKKLYRQRHRIENMVWRLKDWRRVAPRYDPMRPTRSSPRSVSQRQSSSTSSNESVP